MKADPAARFPRPALLLLIAVVALPPARGQDSDRGTEPEPPVLDEVRLIAQRAALPHLVGERPFILRESAWSGEIEPGKARLIQVQLFKRNDYQFWLAVPDRDAVVGLHLYDGKGNLLETLPHAYETPNVSSLEATPDETGVYYLRVFLAKGETDSRLRWTVVYGYR